MANDNTCPSGAREFSFEVVTISPPERLADYRGAMALAESAATARLGDCMLISWYDADRNFESPQHVSECHRDSAVPGYVDYAASRQATLKIDVEAGRFVFFYLPVDIQE